MEIVLLGQGQHLVNASTVVKIAGHSIVKTISSLSQINHIDWDNKNITLVCCLLDDNERESFLEAMLYCHEHQIPFLHPAFILSQQLDAASPETPKIRTYGFPGSGNMLLLDFISDHMPTARRSTLDSIFCSIGSHYMNFFHFLMEKILRSSLEVKFTENERIMYSIAYKYSGIFRITQGSEPDHSFIIHNFPCPSFTWDPLISDHAYPDHDTVNFFDRKKFNQILIIRHPLDTILSNLNKLNCAEDMCRYQVIDILTRHYVEFMKHALSTKEKIYTIKYEDILTDTLPVMRKLSDHADLDVTDEQIEVWKNTKLFKLLPRALSEHFKGGGTDKWMNYFDQKCYDIFEKHGLNHIIAALGYSLPSPCKSATTEPELNSQTNSISTVNKHLEFYYYPFWNNNTAYDHFFTDGGRPIYYKFNDYLLDRKPDFSNACLPIKLLTDSFYSAQEINKKHGYIKRLGILTKHVIQVVWYKHIA